MKNTLNMEPTMFAKISANKDVKVEAYFFNDESGPEYYTLEGLYNMCSNWTYEGTVILFNSLLLKRKAETRNGIYKVLGALN